MQTAASPLRRITVSENGGITENERIADLIEAKDVEKLISRYPLRETPALEFIAKKSLSPSRDKYEQAV